MRSILSVVVALVVSLVSMYPALACRTKNIYPPDKHGDTLSGWGDLSTALDGAIDCKNWIKIERKTWYGDVDVSGWWAGADGWNNVTGSLVSGCHKYRTTAESYNWVIGPWGIGVNLGKVGMTADGQDIYKFKIEWSSAWIEHCQ